MEEWREMLRDDPLTLYHHGIKGQKWGVRRYQNPDGSLTSAGEERYMHKLDRIAYDENRIEAQKQQAEHYEKKAQQVQQKAKDNIEKRGNDNVVKKVANKIEKDSANRKASNLRNKEEAHEYKQKSAEKDLVKAKAKLEKAMAKDDSKDDRRRFRQFTNELVDSHNPTAKQIRKELRKELKSYEKEMKDTGQSYYKTTQNDVGYFKNPDKSYTIAIRDGRGNRVKDLVTHRIDDYGNSSWEKHYDDTRYHKKQRK